MSVRQGRTGLVMNRRSMAINQQEDRLCADGRKGCTLLGSAKLRSIECQRRDRLHSEGRLKRRTIEDLRASLTWGSTKGSAACRWMRVNEEDCHSLTDWVKHPHVGLDEKQSRRIVDWIDNAARAWSSPEEENVANRIDTRRWRRMELAGRRKCCRQDRHKKMKKNVDRIDGCQEKKMATSSAKKHVNECKAKKNFPACQEGLLRVSPSSNNSSPWVGMDPCIG